MNFLARFFFIATLFLNVALSAQEPMRGLGVAKGPHKFFSTSQDALLDAATYINAKSERQQIEFGGWVIQDPATGCYTYFEPVRGKGFHVSIPNYLTVKYTWKLLPITWYHSHPTEGRDGESYSVQDYSVATMQGGRPAALFTPSGGVYVFDPTAHRVETLSGAKYEGETPWFGMPLVQTRKSQDLKPRIQCDDFDYNGEKF